MPEDGAALAVAFGNAGTGVMLVTDVEFRKLSDGDALPAGVAAQANEQPPDFGQSLPGAIADYRMEEGEGNLVLNHAAAVSISTWRIWIG